MSEWDESAAGWDENEAVRAYADGAFASLTSLVEQAGVGLEGTSACDFGCGTGVLTEHLARRCARIDAVDTSPAMLTVLREKIEQRRWDHVRALDRLPTGFQAYDLVLCSSVLAFVDDYPAVAAELTGHLVPGGMLVQWDWEADPHQAEPGGLTAADIRRTLEHAGLEAVNVGIGFERHVDGHLMRPLMGSGRRPPSIRSSNTP